MDRNSEIKAAMEAAKRIVESIMMDSVILNTLHELISRQQLRIYNIIS